MPFLAATLFIIAAAPSEALEAGKISDAPSAGETSKAPGAIKVSRPPSAVKFSKAPGAIKISRPPSAVKSSQAPGAVKISQGPGAIETSEAATPQSLAAGIVAAYRRGGDMTATFTQVYTDSLRHRTRQEAGHLWVKADGRVRWSYETPEIKEFIFNGSSAFFYEPQSAQVTVFEAFADSPLSHAMQFLWGRGDLQRSFTVELAPPAADVPALRPREKALLLTPRQSVAAVDHVVLVVDTQNFSVRQSRVVDPLGNFTDYLFDAMKFGTAISAQTFAFTIPEGVSVLRAAAQAPTQQGQTPAAPR